MHERIFESEHPCPGSLEFAMDILYKPVVILGVSKKLLINNGFDNHAWTGDKVKESKSQWVIYPVGGDNAKVILKSVSDLNNIALWCDKGPQLGAAKGFVSEKIETKAAQFTLESYPDLKSGSFILQSELNGNSL